MSGKPTAPAIDPLTVPVKKGTGYPEPFRAHHVEEREKRKLGDALGLNNFGVNLVTLAPGGWSAQRHWHEREDEFVYVLSGELTLVTDAGEQTLGPGMAAGFPAGKSDGHHLINKSTAPATYLEVGDRYDDEVCHYPDIDLVFRGTSEGEVFTNRKGEPY